MAPTGKKFIEVTWSPVDFTGGNLVSNYSRGQDRTTAIRQTNRALAISILGRACNHLLAQQPRVVFSKAQPEALISNTDSAPLYRWKLDDLVTNARDRQWSVITVEPESVTDTNATHYWVRLDDTMTRDNTCKGPESDSDGGSEPEDAFIQHAVHQRGDVPGTTEYEEGIEAVNTEAIWEMVVQDFPFQALETANQNFIPDGPFVGQPCLADYVEEIRAKFHDLRSKNLPIVLSWAAQKNGASYETTTIPTSSGYGAKVTGIRLTTTTYTNVLDGTTTGNTAATRSASVAGWPCFVQYQGIGATQPTAGKEIRIQCRVFAAATNAGGDAISAGVRFIGPDLFSNNFTDIPITLDASPAWYGDDTNSILLNSRVGYSDTTTDRAKIDVFAGVADSGDNLYIYGIRCWAEYMTGDGAWGETAWGTKAWSEV